LQRVWRLVLEPELIVRAGSAASEIDSAALTRKVHQTIRKVTDDYQGFRFNTAVAALMELTNACQDYVAAGGALDGSWMTPSRT
jgi:leucyl-tRNA synthetase